MLKKILTLAMLLTALTFWLICVMIMLSIAHPFLLPIVAPIIDILGVNLAMTLSFIGSIVMTFAIIPVSVYLYQNRSYFFNKVPEPSPHVFLKPRHDLSSLKHIPKIITESHSTDSFDTISLSSAPPHQKGKHFLGVRNAVSESLSERETDSPSI